MLQQRFIPHVFTSSVVKKTTSNVVAVMFNMNGGNYLAIKPKLSFITKLTGLCS